jgi:hypothetical protein
MKQEPKSIYDFTPGDIVTRIQPSVIVNKSMFMGGLNYDSSYVGEKLIFVGIANGCAYFEPTDSWAHYIDPTTLINAKRRSKYESMSDTTLVAKLDEAIEVEDYEEASRIKHEIDKREI